MAKQERWNPDKFDTNTIRINDDDRELRERLAAYGEKHRYNDKSDLLRDLVKQALDKPEMLETRLQTISEELFQFRGQIRALQKNIDDRAESHGTDPETPEKLDALTEEIRAIKRTVTDQDRGADPETAKQLLTLATEIRSLRDDMTALKRLRGELARAVGSILSMQRTLTEEEAQDYVKRAFSDALNIQDESG